MDWGTLLKSHPYFGMSAELDHLPVCQLELNSLTLPCFTKAAMEIHNILFYSLALLKSVLNSVGELSISLNDTKHQYSR